MFAAFENDINSSQITKKILSLQLVQNILQDLYR